MTNEDRRMEVQKKMTDEERVRRLREGGGEMRAQLAMEEAQRSSRDRPQGGEEYLTPEEQQRRMMSGKGEPFRGYGETKQAEMRMWGREGESPEKQMERGSREMTEEEMRRSGSDRVGYPSGTGSYYSETFEKPTSTTGPESSFGRTENMPSGKAMAQGETAGTPTGKVKEAGETVVAKGKDVGTEVMSRTKELTSKVTTKAKEFNESNRAEEMAHRAGEAIGSAIRKTVSIAREMGSGLRKGLGQEERGRKGERMAPREQIEERPSGKEAEPMEREPYTRETPSAEEKYEETRKKENR